jgi:hypothetical protein
MRPSLPSSSLRWTPLPSTSQLCRTSIQGDSDESSQRDVSHGVLPPPRSPAKRVHAPDPTTRGLWRRGVVSGRLEGRGKPPAVRWLTEASCCRLTSQRASVRHANVASLRAALSSMSCRTAGEQANFESSNSTVNPKASDIRPPRRSEFASKRFLLWSSRPPRASRSPQRAPARHTAFSGCCP